MNYLDTRESFSVNSENDASTTASGSAHSELTSSSGGSAFGEETCECLHCSRSHHIYIDTSSVAGLRVEVTGAGTENTGVSISLITIDEHLKSSENGLEKRVVSDGERLVGVDFILPTAMN